jgi:thiol:disulfide interchange protein DsbC
MLKKILFALAATGFATIACAADNDEKVVRDAVQSLSPTIKIDSASPSTLPGFYKVIVSGRLIYVSNDGHYMMDGDLIDLKSRKNLSEQEWAVARKAALAKVPASERLVYSPPNPTSTITVFTDPDCGYCRELHKHIEEFNKQGIAVEYLFWPREGVKTTGGNDTPTYTKTVSVWCSDDRKAAFNEAVKGKEIKPATCANPVNDEYELGLRLGVTGTPTVVAEDGTVIGGYLTPAQMQQAMLKVKMNDSAKTAGR